MLESIRTPCNQGKQISRLRVPHKVQLLVLYSIRFDIDMSPYVYIVVVRCCQPILTRATVLDARGSVYASEA